MSSLSIVLHGVLNVDYPDEDIVRLKSWRHANSDAEIVFSISQFVGTRHGRFVNIAPEDKDAGLVLSRMKDLVDAVVVAPLQESLPPLKFDDKINNCNKMLSAARTGLGRATREYTLRIRSDAYICRIDRILEEHSTYKGDIPSDGIERITICPWFTLNPYLLERLPFHFSDWFNFGRTSDLRTLWDAEYFTFEDAIYFEYTKHLPFANPKEKQFRSRFSPEQHIILSFARKLGYDLPNFAYERGFESATLKLLREKFLVTDIDKIGFSLPKYNHLRTSAEVPFLCVGHCDWVMLQKLGVEEFERHVADKTMHAKRFLQRSELKKLKYRYPFKYRLAKFMLNATGVNLIGAGQH